MGQASEVIPDHAERHAFIWFAWAHFIDPETFSKIMLSSKSEQQAYFIPKHPRTVCLTKIIGRKVAQDVIFMIIKITFDFNCPKMSMIQALAINKCFERKKDLPGHIPCTNLTYSTELDCVFPVWLELQNLASHYFSAEVGLS